MSKKTIKSKANVIASYQLAIQGVRQILPNKTLLLNGAPMTSKAIIALPARSGSSGPGRGLCKQATRSTSSTRARTLRTCKGMLTAF